MKYRLTKGLESKGWTGSAFVVFERISYQDLFLRYYESSELDNYRINFTKIKKKGELEINGNRIVVNQADPPTDVLWLNQHYTLKDQVTR